MCYFLSARSRLWLCVIIGCIWKFDTQYKKRKSMHFKLFCYGLKSFSMYATIRKRVTLYISAYLLQTKYILFYRIKVGNPQQVVYSPNAIFFYIFRIFVICKGSATKTEISGRIKILRY